MFEIIANSVGVAYLVVLSVLGYVVLLTVINKFIGNQLLRIFLVTTHFVLGITAIMLFPSAHYRSTLSQHDITASIIFATVVIIGLIIVFRVLLIISKSVEWK